MNNLEFNNKNQKLWYEKYAEKCKQIDGIRISVHSEEEGITVYFYKMNFEKPCLSFDIYKSLEVVLCTGEKYIPLEDCMSANEFILEVVKNYEELKCN